MISAMLLLKQVNVGGSTKTVIGRALRESVTTASPSPVSEVTRVLWAPADLYDRIEAALRTKAGLAVRPTGAIVAGLGAAGDHGAKV